MARGERPTGCGIRQNGGINGLVNVELHGDGYGEVGKTALVLFAPGSLAAALAQEHLVIDQIEEAVGVIGDSRVPLDIIFDAHAVAPGPAFALVIEKAGD